MNHFIITRFNLRLWTSDKNHQPVQTAEWLEHRFRLFETYCLPSIKAQTNQNFRWLCLFDSATPQEYKDRIRGYMKDLPQLDPGFFDAGSWQDILSSVRYEIKRLAGPGRIITTYLDNDDAVREDYVERVQGLLCQEPHNTVVTFKYGMQYYKSMGLLMHLPFVNNHFQSMVEDPEISFNTIFCFSHYYVFEIEGLNVKIVDEPRQPMWIEVVHERNVINTVWRRVYGLPERSPQVISGVGCRLDISSHPRLYDYFLRFWPMMVWKVGKRGVKRIINR